MRVNRYIAQATGLSRRAADLVIGQKRVTINGEPATVGANIHDNDIVLFNGRPIKLPATKQTILLNKPIDYVCSRKGQGSRTIYELLPEKYHHLKPVGRLDKDSSGVLLLTNDGDLAHRLAHPGFRKEKRYYAKLDRPLQPEDQLSIQNGVKLLDGPSKLKLEQGKTPEEWFVSMHEGRNRQIRRTFECVGYRILKLERTQFGPYKLEQLGNQRFVFL
ncbi:MAG: pseudouridine synthase [Candidatus Saccharibacteria bacterium]